MLARVFSGATVGLESILIEVEVDIASQGLPSFTIVGTQYLNLKFLRLSDLNINIDYEK